MRRLLTTCGWILALTLGAGSARAADYFTGFYQSIDSIDGSLDSLSITPTSGRKFDILVSSTGLSFCGDGNEPGFITATARKVHGGLLREDVVATCSETGVTVMLPKGIYTSSNHGELLTIVVAERKHHYHRISGGLRWNR